MSSPSASTPSSPFNVLFPRNQRSPFDVPLMRREIQLAPFTKLKINRLATTKDFEEKFKITQIMKGDNIKATVLVKNIANTGFSIGKIYNCGDSETNSKKKKQQIKKHWNRYQVIKYSGLMEYFQFYYDIKRSSVTIHMQAYQQTLRSFITQKGPLQNESKVKIIANDILKKLLRLHEYNYVHSNLKPNNIMERRLDHLYTTEYISDGWLLIDFDNMHKNNTKDIYCGHMGWTAPEINYKSDKNIYRYSSDVFSFGLIILYIMFNYNPLEIPQKEIKKYKIKSYDNCQQIKETKLKDAFYANWYNEHILKSENRIKNYLIQLYYDNKISLALFELLHDGILTYSYKKRLSCKQIYYSPWLSDININSNH